MRSILDPESPILQFITKIVYSVWLNILWFVCCLPVITIGPSTTALFYACQKMARDEEGYITRSFFHSFRQNLKQGIVIGLIMTVSGGLLIFDGFVLARLYKTSPFWAILTAVFIVACGAWLIISMWVFPLLAHFDNTTGAMFKNAIMLGMRFLVCTALMAAVYIIMALLIIHVMTPLIIFGMGTCAYINSILLKRILIQCETKSTGETGEIHAEGDTQNTDTENMDTADMKSVDVNSADVNSMDVNSADVNSADVNSADVNSEDTDKEETDTGEVR